MKITKDFRTLSKFYFAEVGSWLKIVLIISNHFTSRNLFPNLTVISIVIDSII